MSTVHDTVRVKVPCKCGEIAVREMAPEIAAAWAVRLLVMALSIDFTDLIPVVNDNEVPE